MLPGNRIFGPIVNLRPYQSQLLSEIYAAWNAGAQNVLAQLPTGGGKTVLFSHVVKQHQGASVVLAHRQELVSQMSLALAREGVRHRVIGPDSLRRLCVAAHMVELGRTTYNANAACAVASVQSINPKTLDPLWAGRVSLWVHDEGHHLCRDNLFGRAVANFPDSKGLSVTATPGRADGKGLGRHADGVIDAMVQGPHPCELIEMGFLSRYRIFAPPSSLHREDIPVTASGDFSPVKLREATKGSTVTGDIVAHYVKHASGKLGLTFADSIENAVTIAEKFRAAGVRAEVLTGKTPDLLRARVPRQFKNREVMQIISVALIDEGFDCPAVEVVSDGAATESFGRYAQRFGRGLRVLEGKTEMLYFDHVGNVVRHNGAPTEPRSWSLARREKRESGASDAVPVRVCANPSGCASVYERYHKSCPYCGYCPEPAARTAPEFVDGDLFELTPETLAALRGKVAQIEGAPRIPQHLDALAQAGVRKQHAARLTAQMDLRELIALWAGWQNVQGFDLSQSYRKFWHAFGVDVLSAQALGRPEAEALAIKIRSTLDNHGVIAK